MPSSSSSLRRAPRGSQSKSRPSQKKQKRVPVDRTAAANSAASDCQQSVRANRTALLALKSATQLLLDLLLHQPSRQLNTVVLRALRSASATSSSSSSSASASSTQPNGGSQARGVGCKSLIKEISAAGDGDVSSLVLSLKYASSIHRLIHSFTPLQFLGLCTPRLLLVVRELLEDGANPNHLRDGKSALHLAVGQGDRNVLRQVVLCAS